MWTIVVPCAGEGKRLGGAVPKPLVLVDGRPMVEVAVESIGLAGRFVFVAQRKHHESHRIADTLSRLGEVVLVDHLTEGPAASVLAARHLIDESPLLIANCDQRVTWDSAGFRTKAAKFDGLIAVHRSSDPRFSYALERDGLVVRTAEKDPISDLATSGVYWFSTGLLFLTAADLMVAADDRHNGEFYVAPVYNHAVSLGARVGTFDVQEMRDMGSVP